MSGAADAEREEHPRLASASKLSFTKRLHKRSPGLAGAGLEARVVVRSHLVALNLLRAT